MHSPLPLSFSLSPPPLQPTSVSQRCRYKVRRAPQGRVHEANGRRGVELSTQNLFTVKDKIALVTGGGSGIGKMIAAAFVANGARVYIAARKEGQLRAAAEELNTAGPGTCEHIVADLSNKAGCQALISTFKSREQKLHILVNNSGVAWGAPYDDFPEKEGWDRVLAVNVKSIFYMTQGLTDYLAKDATSFDPGRVINISSTASLDPHAEDTSLANKGNGLWSYNTSKAAANHLTSLLAVTLCPQHITVNAILPGVFPSKMTAFGFRRTGEDKMAAAQPSGESLPLHSFIHIKSH
ncbi:hypothetical protein ACEPAI_1275 [Sanghuangporus weigelae]